MVRAGHAPARLLTDRIPNADDARLRAADTAGHPSDPASVMSMPHPSSFVFVVKLRAGAGNDPRGLSGRVEHVLSGRRHDFDSSAALLACLQQEQQEVQRGAGLVEPAAAKVRRGAA
jgi:hypothetical protein